MKVSLNWVKQFTHVNLPVDALVEKIGAQLGAVEEVVDLGKKYEGILVVKVVASEKHPNADKLSFCQVDDNGVNKKVKRNKNSLIEIVCGAPNVKAGMLAAWIPPGTTIPSTFEKDPFTIEARDIRGKTSHGMLASARELALGDDHDGILEIDQDAKPGELLTAVYDLDDYVIDIENKMFTHRPDLFGMLGIARELAGIAGKPFKSPSWYKPDAALMNDGRKNVLKLEVKNELPKLTPRFCAIAIKDIKVQPSPVWLRVRLASVGVRPINNIVDITNFYMLETAQPLHAYDYDKLKTGVLGVRMSKKGETVQLIGGKNLKLDHEAIVITDGNKPVGLGGVMGGASTEVDEHTKNIILEVATFDMNTTRRTAMTYGLFTDAATRFTKNQSPLQNRAVIVKALEDVKRLAGGRGASPLIDDKNLEGAVGHVSVKRQFINERLGLNLTVAEMKRILTNVEFDVETSGDELSIKAPFWRTDIEIPEDIVEEVGRLYGYDHLPLDLPKRTISPSPLDGMLELKSRIRNYLSAAGANELLTYSFVHESLIKKAGQDPAQAYHIRNALSPELQYYRLSLMPSLLEKVHPNIKLGFDGFAIFEMNKSHDKTQKDEVEKELPREIETLALAVAGQDKTHKQAGSAYFQARNYLDALASHLGVELKYQPLQEEPKAQPGKPFEVERSAHIYIAGNEKIAGVVGEFKPSAALGLKLPSFAAGFEISLHQLLQAAKPKVYLPLNRYPALSQDLCLRTSVDLPYQTLTDFLAKSLSQISSQHGYIYEISPLDIFQKTGELKHKQTTWHIELAHPDRTLTTEEVNNIFDRMAGDAKTNLNAERI